MGFIRISDKMHLQERNIENIEVDRHSSKEVVVDATFYLISGHVFRAKVDKENLYSFMRQSGIMWDIRSEKNG